ncbi:hypothetical protein C4A75_09605 [Brevibacillus laterosporus]|uniref:hypothetical protein n=1 Tax=Brevibacillus laterosporus TaxID=1465 RepID=UPI000CE32FBD|nr:hypothetical protein [Brevibacillus laterosporus]PPA85023.1 hypothetical protein C4A75_09605 [Brevibacillus laterosporus]
MPKPKTNGEFRTDIESMNIGDYIPCTYIATYNKVGKFENLGIITGEELTVEYPFTSLASPNGYFYFIKADNGLLISDRVVQCEISWQSINQGKCIEGLSIKLGNVIGQVRSLSGGSKNIPNIGVYPENNEWNTYIVNSTLNGNIVKGDDYVWHWREMYSWSQDCYYDPNFSSKGVYRTVRGVISVGNYNYIQTDSKYSSYGFRPVFEYKELN